MSAAVLYASRTGHSKKIARFLGESLQIPVYNGLESPQIPSCDLLYVVSGIYGGKGMPEFLEFARSLGKSGVERVALLTSSLRQNPQTALREAFEEQGIPVFREEFTCRGGFLFFSLSHPDQKDLAAALSFAEKALLAP